jgi:hypothetical protein
LTSSGRILGVSHGIEDLIERVADKAFAPGNLRAVLSLDDVRVAERTLGFALPPQLVALYTSVRDGGYGPGQDVSIPEYTAGRLYPLRTAVKHYIANREHDPAMPYSPWPEKVLPLLSLGCFAELALDCSVADGPVLLYEADVDEIDPAQAWTVEATTLRKWLESWALPPPMRPATSE